jgi:hypothetical protein
MKAKDVIQYIFSALIILATLAWFTLLLYKAIPEENRDLVTTAAGVFLGSGWTQILNWWFGSSKGSNDKTEIISKMPSIDNK